MTEQPVNKNLPPRNPFRGMLIFVIIILIIAWLIYRNRSVPPTVKPGDTATVKSGILSGQTHLNFIRAVGSF